jgi:hypothetical protein
MSKSGSTRSDVRRTAVTAAAVTGVALLIAMTWLAGTPATPAEVAEANDTLLSAVYDPPTRPVEIHLARGDGQIFATHAQDPLMRRPELIRGGEAEQAYRLQRPLYGWLGWAASGGQAGLAPWALIGITIVSVGFLAAVVARFLEELGCDGRWAALIVLIPGVMTDLTWVGPEVLGTALLVVGIRAWRPANRRLGVALVAFALAGLARETLLLVPAVLVIVELVRYRSRWRDAVALALTAVPYVAWVGVLRLRIGVWPGGSVDGRLSPLPFGGLVDVAGAWGPSDLLAAVVVLVPAIAVLARRGPGAGRGQVAWAALIVGHLALAAVLGAPVWTRHADFDRVLLPLTVISFLALMPSRSRTTSSADVRVAGPVGGRSLPVATAS